MSVTIGDQKFVKDANKGWIDAKTKQPADTGLIKLLDSLMVEEPEVKKLRVKIDRNVEPVFINGQKFVYDVNQGWLDEKTKIAVPPSLQTILNSSLSRFEQVGAGPSVFTSYGMTGEAALQKTKSKKPPKTGGGVLVKNQNVGINKPLIAMINQLASIDSYLKQQLQNNQIISLKEVAQAKEASIEAKDTDQAKVLETPDAEKESNADLIGAVALAGLIALQFDPVKETISSLANFGKEAASYVIDVAKTINGAFEWLLGDGAATSSTASAGNIGPTEYTPNDYFKSPPAFASYAPVTQPALTTTPSAGILSADPKVREQAFTQKSAPTSQKPIATTPAPAAKSSPKANTQPPANAFFTAKPNILSNDPIQRAQAIVEKDKTKTYGLKAKGGRTSGRASAPTIPKNDIVALANYLVGQGAEKSKMEHMAISGRVGEHSNNSRHYRGMAIDVNFPGPNEAAILDALAPQIKAAGYNVLWRTKGHYSHMHVSVGGPEGIGGFGGGESPIANAVDTITDVMSNAKNIFGKVGAALIGTDDYTKRELTTAASKLGPMAKSYEMAKTDAMAESRTPKPTPSVSKTVSPANINPNKSSPVIQTPATESDMGGVNYYLERFGFMPAQSEMAII